MHKMQKEMTHGDNRASRTWRAYARDLRRQLSAATLDRILLVMDSILDGAIFVLLSLHTARVGS